MAAIRLSPAPTSANTFTTNTLSLHDALPILARRGERTIELSAREFALLQYLAHRRDQVVSRTDIWEHIYEDRKSTRLNSSHVAISYAVFCLIKKITDVGAAYNLLSPMSAGLQ